MGEVWRARDPRLGRDVAIKVSAQQFSDRFEREARAIAALNHPNICTLYDVGPNYLVMEFVEGADLKGPVPLERALATAGQIAAALEAAHEKGIVHRDLKPGNIRIKPDGSVKVLDFGLAKSATQQEITPDSPTMLTVSGMILGTARYMSPEQARGQEVDKRADIFSFGVVLYELSTGARLFDGATVSDTIAAVLTREPDFEKVPAKVRRLLRACLQKDPGKRLRDIGDWAQLLEEGPREAKARAGWPAWAIAGVLAFGLAAVSFIHFGEKPVDTPLVRSSILPPENAAFTPFDGAAVVPAVSPDGRRIVFVARTRDGKDQLWVRPLDSTGAQLLAGTEGATLPFWSPDGKSIGFFAGHKLNRIDAAGGPALVLADVAGNARGASWSPQGVIVFTQSLSGPLRRVSAAGGAVSEATRLSSGDATHRWPWFLPDGRHFLFSAGHTGIGRKAIRLGSLESAESSKLLEADSNAIYSAGYLLFLRGDTLMAQPFDARTLRLSGEALPAAEHVRSYQQAALGAFSASGSGLLAYMAGATDSDLSWFDRKGNRTGSLGDGSPFHRLNFSTDRHSLAVGIANGSSTDIWLFDVARGLRTRFTFDTAGESDAVWSPDAKTIVFDSTRRGHSDVYRKAANGSGEEELLYSDQVDKYPLSISPDGKSLLYLVGGGAKSGADLWILPNPLGANSAARPFPILHTQANENYGQFSPDGHWIAYASDESGRYEVYLAPFPGPGGRRQVSPAGGEQPRWRADGKEIFYVAADQRLMAAEVALKGGGIETGEVHPLFGPLSTGILNQYDVSADGQRILAITPRQNASEPLTIVQNWPAELKK
jgi:Tol biopolymer transport system component/predicted Ser/Thr protein kinase